jgi:hypothetical protein
LHQKRQKAIPCMDETPENIFREISNVWNWSNEETEMKGIWSFSPILYYWRQFYEFAKILRTRNNHNDVQKEERKLKNRPRRVRKKK